MPPEIAAQTEMIEGATRSRSNLASGLRRIECPKEPAFGSAGRFEEPGHADARVTDLRSRGDLDQNRGPGNGQLRCRQSWQQVEAALKALGPLVLEYAGLCQRLEDLPGLEMEMARRQSELAALKERQEQLIRQIQALGYTESDYMDARKRQATLKPLHDRFLSLSERVAQIPALKERIIGQEQEIERLDLRPCRLCKARKRSWATILRSMRLFLKRRRTSRQRRARRRRFG